MGLEDELTGAITIWPLFYIFVCSCIIWEVGEWVYGPDEFKYRFIDLRRKEMHENIKLRSNVISYIRKK